MLPINNYSGGGIRFEPEDMTYSDFLKINTNLVPFKSFIEYFEKLSENRINVNSVIKHFLYNIVVFAFITVFTSLSFNGNTSKTIAFSACFAIFLELLQFISKSGICDIDSVILRFIGILAGYLICKIFTAKKAVKQFK